jgi:heterodisulfide reductase subunit B
MSEIMKFALLRCCPTPTMLKQYELSANAVLQKLGIEAVDIKEFSCCGYPIKNFNFKAYVLASARNLALSERENLDLLTVCNCCYGSLKHVDHLMKDEASLRNEINLTLEKEGLQYEGDIGPKHFLQVLYDDIGIETIRDMVVSPFDGLKIATHYGCHLLRPREVVQFDNPFSPTKLDQLVEITGAKSVDWLTKLECCGSPLWGVNDELSLDLTENKLKNAKQGGADYLCVVCTYCQLQFDRVQNILISQRSAEYQLPSILYTQLLGLSLGIDGETLGLAENQVSISEIESFLLHKEAS